MTEPTVSQYWRTKTMPPGPQHNVTIIQQIICSIKCNTKECMQTNLIIVEWSYGPREPKTQSLTGSITVQSGSDCNLHALRTYWQVASTALRVGYRTVNSLKLIQVGASKQSVHIEHWLHRWVQTPSTRNVTKCQCTSTLWTLWSLAEPAVICCMSQGVGKRPQINITGYWILIIEQMCFNQSVDSVQATRSIEEKKTLTYCKRNKKKSQ